MQSFIWKYEAGALSVKNELTGQELSLGRCEGLDGGVLAQVLNRTSPDLTEKLLPPEFLWKPKVQWVS